MNIIRENAASSAKEIGDILGVSSRTVEIHPTTEGIRVLDAGRFDPRKVGSSKIRRDRRGEAININWLEK